MLNDVLEESDFDAEELRSIGQGNLLAEAGGEDPQCDSSIYLCMDLHPRLTEWYVLAALLGVRPHCPEDSYRYQLEHNEVPRELMRDYSGNVSVNALEQVINDLVLVREARLAGCRSSA